jgi:thiamine-phosphate pyrophosphorylase
MTRFPRGLYALTPDLADTRALAGLVGKAIRGALPPSSIGTSRRRRCGASRPRRCSSLPPRRRPLIVNDDVELASRSARTVRISAAGRDLAEARRRLGSRRLLGVVP